MAKNPWDNQPTNRNFLSPVGFKFILNKAPKVDFYSNFANIPAITLGSSLQTRYGKNIDLPGDKMTYGDLNIRFLVDENLENYLEIHNWMTGLGYPFSLEQYKDFKEESFNYDKTTQDKPISDYLFYETSDGSLSILNSNFTETARVVFYELFPTNLSSLEFDATAETINYFTAQVNFKYTYYEIETFNT